MRNFASVVPPVLFGGPLLLAWNCAGTLDSEKGLLTWTDTKLRESMLNCIFFFCRSSKGTDENSFVEIILFSWVVVEAEKAYANFQIKRFHRRTEGFVYHAIDRTMTPTARNHIEFVLESWVSTIEIACVDVPLVD